MNNTVSEIQLKYTPMLLEPERLSIKNSQSAYKVFLNNWDKDTIELFEEFKVMLLNRASRVLGIYTLSKGGISATIVDVKLLLAVVLKSASSSIILAHNHPSGNLKPSEADKTIYQKIKKAANYLDIAVLDNLIVSKEGFYSFADNGE